MFVLQVTARLLIIGEYHDDPLTLKIHDITNDNIFHIKIIIYLEINLIQNKFLYNWANFEKEICNRLDAKFINFKK